MAAQHLVDLGHRQIGILNADGRWPGRHRRRPVHYGARPSAATAHARLARRSRRSRHLPIVAQASGGTVDDSREAAVALLTTKPRPTAVLCFSDVFALGVLRSARVLGLDVPADLSVIGFDDTPAARTSEPALTTVRQDVAAKGRLAAAALNAAIEHAPSGSPAKVRHHVLPTELVVRETTARLRSPRAKCPSP